MRGVDAGIDHGDQNPVTLGEAMRERQTQFADRVLSGVAFALVNRRARC
jgi:hypothetical protein